MKRIALAPSRPEVTRYFHPVLPASRLRKAPVQVQIAGTAYALFRDERGRAAALHDRCPHRFAPLSKGHVRPDGRLACAYHGWNFDREGRGQSPSQPGLTKCDVPTMQLVERHGYFWLAEHGVAPSTIPELSAPGYRFCGAFPVRFDAPLHVAFDNFSEDEHTPFVHTRLGWTEEGCGDIAFDAENFPDRTEVHYAAPQRPSRVARIFGLRAGDRFHNDWVTRFDPVHTIYTTQWKDPKTHAPRPISIRSPIFFVPETETTTLLHTFVFTKLDGHLARFFPILKHLATAMAWGEIRDDAAFIPTVKGTPRSLDGMRLGKYDKPIIHNHRLLERLYWGGETPAARSGSDPMDPEPTNTYLSRKRER